MTFAEMDLIQPIKQALVDRNYKTPTEIQAKTIPHSIAGRDVLGCAQTGTGKTAAFALPILNFLGSERPKRKSKRPTTLVLAPTRELANQIAKSFQVYVNNLSLRQVVVYGGVSQFRQVKAVRNGVDIMVATPGRLLDLIQQKHIELGNVKYFVLDEADRMLDMGFLPELRKIISMLPKKRQSLFFSATLPEKITELASSLLDDPVSVSIAPQTEKTGHIQQIIKRVNQANKLPTLLELLKQDGIGRAIVFTRTKRGADRVSKKLSAEGINAAAIHGDKSQNARERVLRSFSKKRGAVLVATDVASRGIDVRGVTHVFNFDAPDDPETYVHRIGRTGRAGADGVAVTFCSPAEKGKIRAIERLLDKDLLGEKRKTSGGKKKSKKRRSNAETTNRSNSGKNRKRKGFWGRKKKKGNSSKRSAATA